MKGNKSTMSQMKIEHTWLTARNNSLYMRDIKFYDEPSVNK